MAKNDQNFQSDSNFKLFFATFKHMKRPFQMLLIPLTISLGFYEGFFLGEFIAAWVACPTFFGVDYISLILITYGLCNALSSLCCGVLTMYTGRQCFEGIATLGISTIIILMYSTLDDDSFVDKSHTEVFFFAGIIGIVEAVWRYLVRGNIYSSLYAVYLQLYSYKSFFAYLY